MLAVNINNARTKAKSYSSKKDRRRAMKPRNGNQEETAATKTTNL